jgi:hypothetical protein
MVPMEISTKRIDRAWQETKDWITEFDGSATQAYLPGITDHHLAKGLQQVAGQAQDFRITIVSAEDEGTAVFADLDTLAFNVDRLRAGQIAGLNINCKMLLDDLPLELHLVIHPSGKTKADLEIVWWADQVFDEEGDARARFNGLIGYFITLQNLFQSGKLYIGPESFEKPRPGSQSWIDI